MVDVRDVADLHLRALANPRSIGQRFLAAAGQPVTLPQIAAMLRSHLGAQGRRVPTRQAPDWVIRAGAQAIPALRELAGLLGEPKRLSVTKATDVLGWQSRSVADTMTATAESLRERQPIGR